MSEDEMRRGEGERRGGGERRRQERGERSAIGVICNTLIDITHRHQQ